MQFHRMFNIQGQDPRKSMNGDPELKVFVIRQTLNKFLRQGGKIN